MSASRTIKPDSVQVPGCLFSALCSAGSENVGTMSSNLHPPARFLCREGLGRTDGQLVFLPCAQSNLYTCAVPFLEFVSAESVELQ